MSKDAQVDHILKLMLNGQWKGAQSNQELSAKWKCHPRTVSDRACEASAVLKRLGGPVEAFIERKLAELEALQAMATADGNVRDAVKAIELAAKIRGALVQKHEHKDTTEERKKLASMSPEERIELHKRAIAEEEEKQKGGMH